MFKLITIFTIITGALIIISTLKIYSICRACRWLRVYGKIFKTKINKWNTEPPKEVYIKIIKELDAKFLPFGLKDYISQEFDDNKKHPIFLNKLIFRVKKWLKYLFFRFPIATIVNLLYLLTISSLYKIGVISIQSFDKWLFFGLAIAFLLANILMSFELIYSYIILGINAVDFHKLTIKYKHLGNSLIYELKLLIITIVLTTFIGSVAFYESYILFNGINIDPNIHSINTIWECFFYFFRCIYFALTTLLTFGNGDYHPLNDNGTLTVLIYEIQSFALIGLVIGAFYSLLGGKDSNKN